MFTTSSATAANSIPPSPSVAEGSPASSSKDVRGKDDAEQKKDDGGSEKKMKLEDFTFTPPPAYLEHSPEDRKLLLGLLAAPVLTAELLKNLTNYAMFHYFSLVVAALQLTGMTTESRQDFSVLVDLFMRRVASNRKLKSKFLLLLLNKPYYNYFEYELIKRSGCYEIEKKKHFITELEQAKAAISTGVDSKSPPPVAVAPKADEPTSASALTEEQKEMKSELSAVTKTEGVEILSDHIENIERVEHNEKFDDGGGNQLKVKTGAPFLSERQATLQRFEVGKLKPSNWSELSNYDDWFFFCINFVFKRDGTGVEVKDRVHLIRVYKNVLVANELCEWLAKNLPFVKDNADAVKLGETMRAMGFIEDSHGNKNKKFEDKKRDFWRVKLQLDNYSNRAHAALGVKETDGKSGSRPFSSLPLPSIHSLPKLKGDKAQKEQQAAEKERLKAEQQPKGITGVQIIIAVDLTDLQTRQVFGMTINDSFPLQSNQRFSFFEVAHPFIAPPKTEEEGQEEELLVNELVVEKIFSSIAAPAVLSLKAYPENSVIPHHEEEMKPGMINKKGDNLFQDMGCAIVFRCMNLIWEANKQVFGGAQKTPYIYTYDILPTGENLGYLEAVSELTAFKDFDWEQWHQDVVAIKDAKKQEEVVDNMLNSAAGAYVSAYILGVRDRHWDNIQIKGGNTLFHIDFGFLLGAQPPIDAPSFSISSAMVSIFTKLNRWEEFVTKCENTLLVLRQNSKMVVSATELVFGQAGWDVIKIKEFLSGEGSLNLNQTEEQARTRLRGLINTSAASWQNMFKQFSHTRIDPVWYGLLKNHFPPAVLVMKAVDSAKAANSGSTGGGQEEVVKEKSSMLTVDERIKKSG